MPTTATLLSHYAVLTAMLAPAFFLTATASLLLSANSRLARIIDRARSVLGELARADEDGERRWLEQRLALQRRRSLIVLRGSQLLYVAISCFVGTSLAVAADALLDYRLGHMPTGLAVLGVLAMFAASLMLAREAALAVDAVNDEMDHGRELALRRGG
jgi:hypothetical protein